MNNPAEMVSSRDVNDSMPWTRSNVLGLAQRLAGFLYDDEAMGIEVACAAQERQRQTIDMRASARERRKDSDHNKVFPNNAQILQWLVLETSRVVEMAQEEIRLGVQGKGMEAAEDRDLLDLVEMAAGIPITGQLMTRRYLASLMCEGFSLNSQKLAVSSSCLLRLYTMSECASLYALVAPNNQIETLGYRQRDQVRERLNKRFGHFLQQSVLDFDQAVSTAQSTKKALLEAFSGVQLARNQPYRSLIERDIIDSDGIPRVLGVEFEEGVRLTRGDMSMFTPWGLPCIAKPGDSESGFSDRFYGLIKGSGDGVKAQILQFRSESDRGEMYRTHALICPLCFNSMAAEIFSHKHDYSWLVQATAFVIPKFALDLV